MSAIGGIRSIAVDGTHVYTGGGRYVCRYLKSDLSAIRLNNPQGAVSKVLVEGTTIYSIAITGTHLYVGGTLKANDLSEFIGSVKKYLKSDLSYVGETPDYGGRVNAIVIG